MADNPLRYIGENGGPDCIDALRAMLTTDEFIGFCKGNIVKYHWRERYKGRGKDIEKCDLYEKWLKEAIKDRDGEDEEISDIIG